MRRVLGIALGLGLLGCDEPLKTVELIEEPRVLGARVEVVGEPERAAPAPGERAAARFLVAAPELSLDVGFALQACAAEPRRSGRSGCASDDFASVTGVAGATEHARIDFTVPTELDASGRVLLHGLLCPAGLPSPDGDSCNGNYAGTQLTLELELARADDANHNPALEAESLLFDDAPWNELRAVEGDCAGLGYVEVQAGTSHTLAITLTESDRDKLPRPSKLDPSRETLQLSHFVTAGDLSRAFQTIAWDSGELERQVTWRAPSAPGLTRFWLNLRDFRGGGDFVERAVCVR